jgi:hypothetical protein
MTKQQLIDRIVNDRFIDELGNHGESVDAERGYRQGWNACSQHVEQLIAQHLNPIDLALDELRVATVIEVLR